MKLITHYYVLSLGEHTNRIYEAFRDKLIDIQNRIFPIESSALTGNSANPGIRDKQARDFIRTVDKRFDHYFKRDPLQFVLVGARRNLSIFGSVTSHHDVLIGWVEGDYSATSTHDLGKIVWPIVKDVMAGTNEWAMQKLEDAEKSRKVASGIEEVGRLAGVNERDTLFVEEDYHMKGGIRSTDHSIIRPEELDIREVNDDAVDAIIEKVLEKAGKVIFLGSGSLTKLRRIALITAN
ncbi:MAG: hypothetical protein U5O15_00660 [Candidatus Krumholzibacteriota bacterium]|nr:hypothetical protein [Candidatus Krumholzibacteriota bacterium]